MKKTILVVALAVALTFAFVASASATSPKTWNSLEDYYSWGSIGGTGVALSSVGANPANPGVHANYLATTAKCGICHSVHRANATGVKLLNTSVATCAGCHRAGSSTVTSRLVSWETGGPHSSGTDASCTSRRCHTSSPHGVGASTYALFGGKLIDDGVDPIVGPAATAGTNGFDVTDIDGVTTLTADEQHAVVAGYTCNQSDCHFNSMFTVLERNYSESRDAMYPLDLTDMVNKTGHLSVAASREASGSYVAATGCTGCHDQTDANTTSGYTFPHSQTADGATNLAGRAYLWMGYAGYAGDTLTAVSTADMKAYDGTCLKCHRDTTNTLGIGLTK